METFAYLTNIENIKHLKKIWPLARLTPDFALKSFLKNSPPFKVYKLTDIQSANGKRINGYLINLLLFSKQIIDSDEKFIVNKVISAIDIAQNLNAEIVGLGGILSDEKFTYAKKLKLPVANGTFYTAWSIIETIYRATKDSGIELKKSNLAVIGASSAVGALCCKRLSFYVSKIIISGSQEEELKALKNSIVDLNSIEVNIEKNPEKAAGEADIVIFTPSAKRSLVNIEKLKKGSIACCIFPNNDLSTLGNKRRNKKIIECGLVKLPHPYKSSAKLGLPEGIIPAALAETMLLTLDNKATSQYLTDNTDIDRLEEIANIAVRHGFETWMPVAEAKAFK